MIKYLLLLVLLAATSSGWVTDDGNMGASNERGISPKSNDVILTIIDTFSVPSAQHMLGLDYQENEPYIAVMDNTSNLIRGVVPNTGTEVWTMPTPCDDTFGICQEGAPDYGWYSNSWASSDIYRWDPLTSEWSVAFANPAGTLGRGLDYDPESRCLWESYLTSDLYRIDETGSSTFFDLWGLGMISGLSLFPYEDELGIVFTFYDFFYFHFYSFDGTSLNYIGEANMYVYNFTDSYGITYNPSTDTFFWSYVVYPSNRMISEMDYEIVPQSALEQCTWGSIKAGF